MLEIDGLKVIGITGGVASGKSTVTEMIRAEGHIVIDADELSREVSKVGGEAISQIEATFGAEFLHEDGTLNRSKMGNLIFQDKAKRAQLESIIHPLIHRMAKQIALKEKEKGISTIFYDAALLVETEAFKKMAGLIVVHCNEQIQIDRLMKRNSIGESEAVRLIQTQLPIEHKKKVATWLIDNNGSLQETKSQIQKILKEIF